MSAEDDIVDFVQAQPMTVVYDAGRSFWKWSELGMQTVVHTNPAASLNDIQRFLRHKNPRTVLAIPLSHDEAQAEWQRISVGKPTHLRSTWYFVEHTAAVGHE